MKEKNVIVQAILILTYNIHLFFNQE